MTQKEYQDYAEELVDIPELYECIVDYYDQIHISKESIRQLNNFCNGYMSGFVNNNTLTTVLNTEEDTIIKLSYFMNLINKLNQTEIIIKIKYRGDLVPYQSNNDDMNKSLIRCVCYMQNVLYVYLR